MLNAIRSLGKTDQRIDVPSVVEIDRADTAESAVSHDATPAVNPVTQAVLSELAGKLGSLGLVIADAAGIVEDANGSAHTLSAEFDELVSAATEVRGTNESIAESSSRTAAIADAAGGAAERVCDRAELQGTRGGDRIQGARAAADLPEGDDGRDRAGAGDRDSGERAG